MALECGWEVLLTHRSGTIAKTCGKDGLHCKDPKRCKRFTMCKKAYDMPTPDGKIQMQAGDRIWPKLKQK